MIPQLDVVESSRIKHFSEPEKKYLRGGSDNYPLR